MVAIFVLTMFLLFLSVDLIVLKIQGKYHPAFEPSLPQFDLAIFSRNSFSIPSNIFISKGHTWLRKSIDGLILIGIDEFGTTALGSLSILNCAAVGKELKRGDMIFEGTYGNKSVKFSSPINGIVKSVNVNILGKKISSPYETWGVQISSDNFSENNEKFLSGNEAINWIKKESIKLKDFIIGHSLKADLAGATMFDGGAISKDTISFLVDNSAIDFEKEFLSL